MKSKKTVAIITARGGSKRIPKKNIKLFAGRPLLEYSISAALDSQLFSRVIVSTDDDEIKKLALSAGAEVPFIRSDKNSNDFSTTSDVLLEVIEELGSRGESYEYMCCLYPTAPFLTAEKVKESFSTLLDNKATSVAFVSEFSNAPQRSLVVKNNRVVFKYPQYITTRSQDLEKEYYDCGQLYWLNVEAFKESKSIYTSNTFPFFVSTLESQDIDTIDDWEIAELKYSLMKKREE